MKILFNNFTSNNLTQSKSKKAFKENILSSDSVNNVAYPKNYYLSFTARKLQEFESAKTIKEAQVYGRKNLGVIEYTGFDESSLDTINFINEGLFNAKNKTKTSIRLPRYIDLKENRNAQMSTNYFLGGTLTVNEKIYHPDNIKIEIERILSELRKNNILSVEQIPLDVNSLTYLEKIDLYHNLRKYYVQTTQLNLFPKDLIIKMLQAGCWGEFDEDDIDRFTFEFKSKPDEENYKTLYEFISKYHKPVFDFEDNVCRYRTIFHELGHLQNYELFFQPDVYEYSCWDRYPKDLKQWLEDKENLKAAFSVSPYSCFGKGEFFAECYSRLLEGKELSAEVLRLYKKICGNKIVLNK